MKTILPLFSGFYNSKFDSYFDQEVEQVMEHEEKDYDQIRDQLDYRKGRLAMAQEIVSVFNQETKLDLKFLEVWSPREYNFVNDKIICEIDDEEMRKIHAKVLGSDEGREALTEVLEEFFTSRSGFISFYSNELEDWDKTWEEVKAKESDHEIFGQTFLTALCRMEDIEDDIFEDKSNIREAAQHIWK